MRNSSNEGITKSIHNYKWVLSIAINIVIVIAVMLATPMMYESNDDFAIAAELADGYPYISFVNYYLCKLLIAIQDCFTDVNIFILSQIIMSFLSFCTILKIVVERSRLRIEILFAAVICTIFSLDHYSDIQFTKTAALLMTSGALLLVDNFVHEKRVPEFIIAIALFFIGAGYRDNGVTPIAAYAGLFLMFWLLEERRIFNIKELFFVAIIALVLMAPHGLDAASDAINRSTPELKLGREYQSARIRVTDYPLLGHYEEAAADYESINISENDLELINAWFFDYEGSASPEMLKEINKVNKPYVDSNKSIWKATKKSCKYALKSLASVNMTGIHIILVFILIIAIFTTSKPKSRVFAIAVCTLTLCVYIAVHYLQRAQYRALYLADAGAVFWILYAMITDKSEDKAKLKKRLCIIGIVATIAMLIPASQLLVVSMEFNKNLVEDEAFTNYYANHMDTLFIVPARTMSQPKEYIEPLSVPSFAKNVAATGGWETLSPYELDRLREYGVYNPITDMINNPKVLYLGENIKTEQRPLSEYYRKWHCAEGENVYFEKVDEIEGVGLYNIVIK